MVTDEEIRRAAAVVHAGGLVAFPTETVYGLGCDARDLAALRRLYAVKGRPAAHPVIVHLADAGWLDRWAAEVPDTAARLAAACWPGPLTLLLPRRSDVLDAVTGGRDIVGLRVPAQPVALALVDAVGDGVAAPSANRFGRVSPTTAGDVRAELGAAVDVVLDGGPCRIGVESTIVDCAHGTPTVVRPGGIDRTRLEEILGTTVGTAAPGSVAAPGTLARHYSPRARVLVVERAALVPATDELLGEGQRVGLIAPAPLPDRPSGAVVLASPLDAEEYARLLYRALRDADRLELDVVVAVPPPEEGIGVAVADRLRRAGATA